MNSSITVSGWAESFLGPFKGGFYGALPYIFIGIGILIVILLLGKIKKTIQYALSKKKEARSTTNEWFSWEEFDEWKKTKKN